jgi:hypothetical protein
MFPLSHVLKRESYPTLTKYNWIVQFISRGQSSSLKASFEIELGPLDFNIMGINGGQIIGHKHALYSYICSITRPEQGNIILPSVAWQISTCI